MKTFQKLKLSEERTDAGSGCVSFSPHAPVSSLVFRLSSSNELLFLTRLPSHFMPARGSYIQMETPSFQSSFANDSKIGHNGRLEVKQAG